MKIITSTVLLFRVVEVYRKLSKLNIPYERTHYTYVHNCTTNMQIMCKIHTQNDVSKHAYETLPVTVCASGNKS
jgi:hypothetical protein